MDFYNDPKSVKEYIKMCEGYDGSHIYEALQAHLPIGSTLLELGSGAGLDIASLKDKYAVTGSDLSDEFLKICRAKYPEIPFLKLNALAFDVGEKFDCIYSNKVLHHLTEDELKRSLKQQTEILSERGVIAHSFWLGEENQEMSGMLFTYYNKAHLLHIISELFEVLSSLEYEEFEEGDSLFVVARRKENKA